MDSQRLFRYVDIAGYLAMFLVLVVGQLLETDGPEAAQCGQERWELPQGHGLSQGRGEHGDSISRETAVAATNETTPSLTPVERQLIEAFRRLDPQSQRILWNTLRHLGSGVPGACVVLAVNR